MKVWTDQPLSAATPSALRKWIGEIGTTAKFTRNLLTPLRSVFEDALNDDLITFNPFDRIALTKLPSRPRPAASMRSTRSRPRNAWH